MKETVIVSTARLPIARAYRGAFNNTEAPILAGHTIREVLYRAKLEGNEVDDVLMGCALQQGTSHARSCTAGY